MGIAGVALTAIGEHVPVQRVATHERLGRPNVVWSRGHWVDVCGAQLGDRRVHPVPATETECAESQSVRAAERLRVRESESQRVRARS